MAEARIKIRRVKPSDLPAIYAIEKASFPDPYSAGFLKMLAMLQPKLFLVATADEEIVGYASAIFEKTGEAHLLSIAIHPSRRRRRLGSRLLTEIIEAARNMGAKSMRLEVREDNTVAQRLYEVFRFTLVSTIPRYYPDGEKAHVFQLDLGQQIKRESR
ncbi:MAG: ribosomal protein S18-alanine N-acetyltransferase [Candidatus Bathyarchaeia archaeon]